MVKLAFYALDEYASDWRVTLAQWHRKRPIYGHKIGSYNRSRVVY